MKTRTLLILLFFSFFLRTFSQISGTYTIPGAVYPSIASAITALNTQGVGPGGVIFNVTPGYTEILVSRLDQTATGTSSNPIKFQKGGSGVNPSLVAYAGTSAPGSNTPDGIWSLNGSDYVTIDGIDLQEAVSNTTQTMEMEYGYGLFKAGPTNGANNNIIRNCTITLNRNNNAYAPVPFFSGCIGIALVACTPTTALTTATVTSSGGASSNNQFYNNTIQNVNCCIVLTGYLSYTNYSLCDFNNDIGGSSAATGNTLINFGGGTGATNSTTGIFLIHQQGFNISFNTLNNNNGSGVNHPVSNRCIWTIGSYGASGTINNNTLTLKGGGTSTNSSVIENSAGAFGTLTNTITINNNTITNCTNNSNVSGYWYGIFNKSCNPVNLNIQNNVFTNNSESMSSNTGYFYFIANTGACQGTINITGNQLSESFPGSIPFNGNLLGIHNDAGTATSVINVNNNNFSNLTFTTTSTGNIYLIDLPDPAINASLSVSGNTWTNLNLNASGNIVLIWNTIVTQDQVTINNNSIVNGFTRTATGGAMECYLCGPLPPTCTQVISDNNFSNITSTVPGSGQFDGICISGGAPTVYARNIVMNNVISNINYNASGGFYGIYSGYSGDAGVAGSVYSGNTVSNITWGGTQAFGFYFGGNVFSSLVYPVTVSGNTVGNITGNSTSTYFVGCFLSSSAAGVNFFNNNIFGIQSSHPTSLVYGVLTGSISPFNIYNNYISDIKDQASAPTSSTTPLLAGIYVSYGTNVNIFDNTILLNAGGTGPKFSTAGIYAKTAATVELRNNIVINTSTPGSTGRTVGYWRSNSSLPSYSALSNNNDFYAGTPGTLNLIYYDGANSIQTIDAYKILVSPRDAASITEYPPFVNDLSTPYNLHLKTTVITLCESGGTVVSSPISIPNDYDIDPRYPNPGYPDNPLSPAMAPDIGADEFPGLRSLPSMTFVFTNPASNVTAVTATLNGLVFANNLSTTVSFQWGTTTGYGNTITATPSLVSGIIPTPVSASLSGLLPSTTYHFRCVGINSTGTYYGTDMSFATVCPPPGAAGTISGLSSVCAETTGVVYSISPVANATIYVWTLPTGASVTGGNNTNSITVSFGTTSGNITVYGTGPCGNGMPASLAVTVNPLPAPTISGQSNMCVNSGYYNYSTEAGSTNYSWNISAGGTIIYGQGSNQVQVTWNQAGAQTLSANYTNGNGCSATIATIFDVAVNPIPGAAGTITGTTSVCGGAMGIEYSVAPIINVFYYVWTLPAGSTIASGEGTNAITVDFASNAASGNITVYGNNLCGNGAPSSLAVIVHDIPSVPVITITGTILSSNSTTGNQWYRNGMLISGATNQTYDASLAGSGLYWDVVTLDSCPSDTSNNIYILITGTDEKQTPNCNFYPVPNDGKFTISFESSVPQFIDITIYNIDGLKIYEEKTIEIKGRFQKKIDLRPVSDGVYTILVRSSNSQIIGKITVHN